MSDPLDTTTQSALRQDVDDSLESMLWREANALFQNEVGSHASPSSATPRGLASASWDVLESKFKDITTEPAYDESRDSYLLRPAQEASVEDGSGPASPQPESPGDPATDAQDSAADNHESFNVDLLSAAPASQVTVDHACASLQAELARQRALPNDGSRITLLTEGLQFCIWATGSQVEVDPYVRLSAFIQWFLMQTEKANGIEPVITLIRCNEVDGFYRDDTDLVSMTSVEENPIAPKAPAPRSIPRYRQIASTSASTSTSAPAREAKAPAITTKIKRIINMKRWREVLGL